MSLSRNLSDFFFSRDVSFFICETRQRYLLGVRKKRSDSPSSRFERYLIQTLQAFLCYAYKNR